MTLNEKQRRALAAVANGKVRRMFGKFVAPEGVASQSVQALRRRGLVDYNNVTQFYFVTDAGWRQQGAA